jgi:hypothetical protein
MMNKEETKPRHPLTVQEFINAWKGGYKGVKEQEGKGYWEDTKKEYKCVIFENIEICQEIHFDKSEEIPHLELKNCKIEI